MPAAIASLDEAQFLLLLGGLGAVVGVCSIVGNVVHWRLGLDRWRRWGWHLDARLMSRWTMGGVIASAFWIGANAVLVFFALVSIVALRQFAAASEGEPSPCATHESSDQALYVVVVIAQYALIAGNAYELFSVSIPLLSVLVLPVLTVCAAKRRRSLECIARRHWAVMLCVYCVSCLPALLMLDIPGFSGKNLLLMIFLLVVAQTAEFFQRLAGNVCGRHPIAPSLMRGQTVEGWVSGAICAGVVGAAASSWLTPFPMLIAGAMALIVALSGFLGSLVMRAIERDRAIKVWGRPIVTDADVIGRLAPLCFSAPWLLHLTHYFYAT